MGERVLCGLSASVDRLRLESEGEHEIQLVACNKQKLRSSWMSEHMTNKETQQDAKQMKHKLWTNTTQLTGVQANSSRTEVLRVVAVNDRLLVVLMGRRVRV